MKQQIYQILSVIAIIASFIPLLLVIFRKLWRSLPFSLFAIYWSLGGIMNLTDKIPGIQLKQIEIITVIYNMFDVPMVLAMIYYTTRIQGLRKFTRIVTPVFLAIELANFIFQGVRYDASKYTLATGLILVITALAWEISGYVQKMEHTEQEKAKVFLHASLLFAYGTFVIIYIFDYYVNVGTGIDNFLIYYISCLIATVIAVVGYFSEGAKTRYAQ